MTFSDPSDLQPRDLVYAILAQPGCVRQIVRWRIHALNGDWVELTDPATTDRPWPTYRTVRRTDVDRRLEVLVQRTETRDTISPPRDN